MGELNLIQGTRGLNLTQDMREIILPRIWETKFYTGYEINSSQSDYSGYGRAKFYLRYGRAMSYSRYGRTKSYSRFWRTDFVG